MPSRSVSEETRRAVVEAALSGVPPTEVAEEHEVTRQYVHRHAEKAKKNAEAELAHWRRVADLVRRGEDQ